MPVIAYFPLANGLLAGRYDDENMPKFPKSLTMKKYVVGGADAFPDGGYLPLLAELRRRWNGCRRCAALAHPARQLADLQRHLACQLLSRAAPAGAHGHMLAAHGARPDFTLAC
mgnify:CR=1 FL=1